MEFCQSEKVGTLFALNFKVMLMVTQTQTQRMGVRMLSAFAFV